VTLDVQQCSQPLVTLDVQQCSQPLVTLDVMLDQKVVTTAVERRKDKHRA